MQGILPTTLLDQDIAAREKAEDAFEALRRSFATPDSYSSPTPALVAYSPGFSTFNFGVFDSPDVQHGLH